MYRPVQFSPGTSVPVGRHFKCQFHKSKQGTHIALHMCMHMHMLHVHVHAHAHVHVHVHVIKHFSFLHPAACKFACYMHVGRLRTFHAWSGTGPPRVDPHGPWSLSAC